MSLQVPRQRDCGNQGAAIKQRLDIKSPPNCRAPDIPIASASTATTKSQTLTRPGLIVVESRKTPTSVGSRYSSPTPA
jgi:hypothetical protein